MRRDERDAEIYHKVYVQKMTKAEVGREYNIHPRTVGRAIDRHMKLLDCNDGCDVYTTVASIDSIYITKGDERVIISKDSSEYEVVINILKEGNLSQESQEKAFNKLSISKIIKDYSRKFLIDGLSVDVEKGVIVYEGYYIDAGLSNRLIGCMVNGEDEFLTKLIKFTIKLHKNPSNRATNEVFNFIKASDIKIDEDGDLLCYKIVKDNYMDYYTGKMSNKVGDVVSMPRHLVDDESTNTCSHGLHVCSLAYLPYYGNINRGRIMVCKVCPSDIVSIPQDYYGKDGSVVLAKARVSKYTVVEEVCKSILL